MFDVGDKVVYPHHGAGTVVKKEKREVLGEKREYLTIQILHNDMTVNVPTENAERVGLRTVIDEDHRAGREGALRRGTEMPKNWNRRFKHNRDKMKTGDIFELAEVVRNLSLRDHEKGLSTGEKQMFVKAKKILASELMYAKGMDEEEAAEWLDDVLSGSDHKGRRRSARRRRSRSPKPRLRAAPAPRSGRQRGAAMSVWAVLVAAGSGERLGLDRPKAFARLGATARCSPRASSGSTRPTGSTRSSSPRLPSGRSRRSCSPRSSSLRRSLRSSPAALRVPNPSAPLSRRSRTTRSS